MPLYVGRYLADTGHLTTVQHGAYMLLLMHYWCNGPLPDDDGMLAAISRLDAKLWRKAVGPVIRQFFRLVDGRLHQKRADAELTKAKDISGKRRAAAIAKHYGNETPHPPPNGAGKHHANAHANAPPKPVDKSANAPANAHALALQVDCTCSADASPQVPSPSKLITSREEKEAAREPAAPTSGPVGGLVGAIGKSLRTKPPPFTPGVVYQLSAMAPARGRAQPQDPEMTPEEQMEILRRMMIEEAAAKKAATR